MWVNLVYSFCLDINNHKTKNIVAENTTMMSNVCIIPGINERIIAAPDVTNPAIAKEEGRSCLEFNLP